MAGLAAAACSRPVSEPLRKAAQFLWSRQADDGGWHSRTYGLLRSGQSLTPFVLDALLDVPETTFARPSAAVARAFDFMKRNTNADGGVREYFQRYGPTLRGIMDELGPIPRPLSPHIGHPNRSVALGDVGVRQQVKTNRLGKFLGSRPPEQHRADHAHHRRGA